MIILGCEKGVPPFKETPKYSINQFGGLGSCFLLFLFNEHIFWGHAEAIRSVSLFQIDFSSDSHGIWMR